jgi:hypothetical protein
MNVSFPKNNKKRYERLIHKRSSCGARGREHVYNLSPSNKYLTHVELGVVYHSLALSLLLFVLSSRWKYFGIEMNVSFFQKIIKKDMRGSSTKVRHAEPVWS